ncbi:hypothetical protein [Taibaiella soli]|uniref:Uncharacterized protein n=1 Tax=Taibaiella soli TaxID=1649169 RepID=A0A2W2BJX0_9BACT|nr:hypothetical protein [Taibaiella soli]PZF73746.1 hypothetical protein DN068_07045 [Taibaiella soli]
MKEKILMLLWFFLPAGVFAQQFPPVLDDLENCTLNEFLSHFKTTEIAIDSLVQVALNDTIEGRMVWYHEYATGTPWKYRGYQQTDRYVASQKFKAYYWILRTCQGRIDDVYDDSVAIFLGKDRQKIFDYEMLNYKQRAEDLEKILAGKKRRLGKEAYVTTNDIGVTMLQKQISDWNRELKMKGLSYLLENNILPFDRQQYRMEKKLTVADFYE